MGVTTEGTPGVRTSNGYMRLEDYCNSTDRGSHFFYTSGIVVVEEELFGIENGWRVCVYVLERSIDGWDAIHDLQYEEYLRSHKL